jgi:hypothetical protein
MSDGHKREKPSDALSADVAITSLTIATERNIHFCIRMILSFETPNDPDQWLAALREPHHPILS